MPVLKVAPSLSLPPDAVTETFGILAVRGAGKSNTAAVMAEEMFKAKLPFVVIDPVRAWWGLRSSRDGKGPGLPIPIFGGRRGDVPLERGAGQLIADLVVDHRLSCVLDITEFDSETARKAFLLDFARRLYQRNEAPLHLFLEEADDYIPQKPMKDELHLLRAWENIVRRGRNRGLGCTLITQRSAVINKDVLYQVQTLIPMRTTGPGDIDTIAKWVRYHHQPEDILASLPSLEDGEAWVWSPHFLRKTVRVRFRLRETFDSGATPKVAAGAHRAPATLADVDLGAVRERMAATIEKAKAEDPRELRRKIAELERLLVEKSRQPVRESVQPVTPKRVEVPVLKDAQLARLEKVQGHFFEIANRVDQVLGRFGELKEQARAVTAEIAGALRARQAPPLTLVPPRAAVAQPAAHRLRTPEAAGSSPARRATSEPAEGLSGPEQRILDALAWLEAIGVTEPEQTAAAFLAGYTIGGGAFNNPRGALRTKGLIAYRGDRLLLTGAGRRLARAPEVALTTEELHRRVLERLPGPEARILAVVLKAYPDAVDNDELAKAAGYEPGGGAFNNPRGRLRSLGLVTYPDRGQIRASDLLFLGEPR